jgi:hypothetical protein
MAGAVAPRAFMSSPLPELIVLAAGGSVAPPLILLTILLLGSRRPLPNATALALGYFVTCGAIGIAGLAFFDASAETGSAVSAVGRVMGATVGGLLIVLGLRSLLKVPDPDAPPSRWIGSISFTSPAKAFGLGMALFPVQIKNLAIFVACVNVIAAAGLGTQASVIALGLVMFIFAVPVLVLIGLYVAVPQRASKMLGSLRTWMERNNRAITVVLCFVFGVFFLVRSFSGL